MKFFLMIFALLTYHLVSAQNKTKKTETTLIRNEIPELAFSVIVADSVLESNVQGFHRLTVNGPVESAKATDYFHLGSNTKAITAYIAAYLVEKKVIGWQTRFFDLFPEYQKSSLKIYAKITLADLLSHRALIRSFTSGAEFSQVPLFKGNKQERRKKFAFFLLRQRPVKLKKELYNYSNAGYTIAALMLEKTSGKSWEMLVDEVLHQKLHLHYRLGWPNLIDSHQPWGHWIERDKLKAVPGNIGYNLAMIEPAGDISMPLKDYSKFIQINIKGLSLGDSLLSRSDYAYLHTSRLAYAMGWENKIDKGQSYSEHTGSAGTFFVYTSINRSKKIAFVVIANSGTDKAQNYVFDFMDQVKKRYDTFQYYE